MALLSLKHLMIGENFRYSSVVHAGGGSGGGRANVNQELGLRHHKIQSQLKLLSDQPLNFPHDQRLVRN